MRNKVVLAGFQESWKLQAAVVRKELQRDVIKKVAVITRFDTQICLYFQYDWAVNITCELAFWPLLCAWTAPAWGEARLKAIPAPAPLSLIRSRAEASQKGGGRWVEVRPVWSSTVLRGSARGRPLPILVAMRTRMAVRIVLHPAQVQARVPSNGILTGKKIVKTCYNKLCILIFWFKYKASLRRLRSPYYSILKHYQVFQWNYISNFKI